MKESKAMLREEMKYLKRGKAPKRVMEHEAREHESMGMERKMKKKMRGGGMSYSGGGGVYRKAADGVVHKGKTKGKMVKMAYGGKC